MSEIQTSSKEIIFDQMDKLQLQGQFDSSVYPMIDSMIEEVYNLIQEGIFGE